MTNFKYSLLETHSFSGTFVFDMKGQSFTAGGKLTIEPNKVSYFFLQFFHNDPFVKVSNKNEVNFVPAVHAIFENNVYVTLLKVRLQMSGFSNGGWSYDGLAEHIVMNNYLGLESEILGVNVSFNLWEEFCFPRGFKKTVKSNENPLVIDIGSDTKLKSMYSAKATMMDENSFFNSVSFDPEIKDIATIEIQRAFENIKEKTEKNRISIFPRSDYLEYLQFIKSTSLGNLNEILKDIQYFSHLLFILTYFPSSVISADIVISKETSEGKEDKGNYSWMMPIGINKKVLQNPNSFSFQMAQITYPKLKNDWPSIVQSWFEKREVIAPFLDVLLSNSESSGFQFEFTRSVDAVKEISKNAAGANKKAYYQYAIEEYAYAPLKNKFLEIFEVSTFEELGKQISDARANIVHRDSSFSSSYKKVEKCAHSVDCFELILFSYIQSQIGVPDNLREKFQNYWLGRAKSKRYLKFTEEV